MKAPRRLEDFAGRWRLSRRIEGLGAPGRIYQGIARWTQAPGGLMQHEAGEWRLPARICGAPPGRYLWQADDDGIDIRHADGSHFHHLALGRGVAVAWAEALPEACELSYNFTRWPDWRTVWRMRAPGHDYTVISDYRR